MNSRDVRDLIDKLVERLSQEGFINPQQPPQITPPPQNAPGGQLGNPQERNPDTRFEITDKAIDFLGFKTLRDLLGSLGRTASVATIRATFPPVLSLEAFRGRMNSATR